MGDEWVAQYREGNEVKGKKFPAKEKAEAFLASLEEKEKK